ncbi:MAG: caa(3)-type oxidase subunit IV [Myxococcota bacterium]
MSEHTEHSHPSYVKIWAILLVMLVISVAGPFLGIQVVTLITAFGVAVVKAFLVAKHFMHINIEKRFIVYITATVLVFMFLFFAGAAPDVMKPSGSNWVKPGWTEVDIERDLSVHGEHQ